MATPKKTQEQIRADVNASKQIFVPEPKIPTRSVVQDIVRIGQTVPTSANPVVTESNRYSTLATPNTARKAIAEADRAGAFDITQTTPQTTQRGGYVSQDQYLKAVEAEQARAEAIKKAEADPNRGLTPEQVANVNRYGRDEAGNIITNEIDYRKYRENVANLEALTKEREVQSELQQREAQIARDIELAYAPRYESARRAGAQASETAFRIQGRAGEGTKSLAQQTELADKQRMIEDSIAAEQRLEQQALVAAARGGSKEELEAIGKAKQAATDARMKAEGELQLRQAGLDEAAIEKSEFNTKMMLDALKEGFEYDPKTNSFTAQEGKVKIDQAVSKMLGFASDEFGNQIMGKNGQPLAIEKDNDTEWGSYQDKYGNTVFYDKKNPSVTKKPGGVQVYSGADGAPSASPTTNQSGIQILGEGDYYTRDDGSVGNLGENCVKFARTNVPNLPYGLYSKQDKINAVNYAVNEGFGGKGGVDAQIGDAILTSEGNVGHAAVVIDIDPNGNLVLAEANYKPGQVTKGRTISRDDPTIYGYVSTTNQPQMSSVINQNSRNEGMNPAISSQVEIESGLEPTDVKFTKSQIKEFEYFDDKQKLPVSIDNAQEEAEFMKNKAIWERQEEMKNPANRADKAVESGNFDELILSSKGGGKPDQAFRTNWNKASTVAAQFESITNYINRERQTDELGNTIDWSPVKGWLAMKNPWDIKAQELDSMLTRAIPNLARGIFGEVGVLTNQDIETYKKTIPNIRQPKELQKLVASATLTIIRDSMKNQLETEAMSGTDVHLFLNKYKAIEKKIDELNKGLGINAGAEKQSLESLANSKSFDLAGARKAGATDEEIQAYLTK